MELGDFPRQEEGSVPMFAHSGVETGFAEINGGKLNYEVAGKSPVLVLAHAVIADRRTWDDQFIFSLKINAELLLL